MAIFHLPDLGEGLAEARIAQWHVSTGAQVEEGQLLVSVETAKAVVEVPAPFSGRLVTQLAVEGQTLATHAPLAEYETRAAPADVTAQTCQAEATGSVVGVLPQTTQVPQGGFIVGRHRFTEARFARQRPAPQTAAVSSPVFEPLEPVRQAMCMAMQGTQGVAQATLHAEADLGSQPFTQITSRLMVALVEAARAEPALNAWFEPGQGRCLHRQVHLGVAVDAEAGLFVPVIQDAQLLSEEGLRQRLEELAVQAHDHRLRPEQMQGATLTLSNVGTITGHFATPVVLPPQVAILAAGRLLQRPVPAAAESSGMAWHWFLPLSLSFDHRVVTGGEAARFLAAVMKRLPR